MKLKINKKKLRKLEPTRNAYLSLASSIIHQQISTKAGTAIYNKFLKLFGKKKPSGELFLKFNITQVGWHISAEGKIFERFGRKVFR